MTDWIPFSRPNWLPLDLEVAMREWCDYPNPGTGPKVVGQLQAALAQFWGVPYDWVLLTSSCTEAIGLWSRWVPADAWAVPSLTWPGSYCEIPQGTYSPQFMDLCSPDTPTHHWVPGVHNVFVRLYGEDHGPVQGKYHIVDSAHDVAYSDPTMHPKTAIAYSFAACKQLSAERGGALVSPSCAEESLRILARSGVDQARVPVTDSALKCGISPSQAGMVFSQLPRFVSDQRVREAVRNWYRRAFEGTGVKVWGESGHLVVLHFPLPSLRHSFVRRMEKRGIRIGTHYHLPRGLHLPNAKSFMARSCTVPCFARWRGKNELSRLQAAIRQVKGELGLRSSDQGELSLE